MMIKMMFETMMVMMCNSYDRGVRKDDKMIIMNMVVMMMMIMMTNIMIVFMMTMKEFYNNHNHILSIKQNRTVP